MLVLTRSCEEEIRIGDDIVVRVLTVKGDRVRIGVQAPADVAVHRQEVYLEIERANQESLAIHSDGLKKAQELAQNGAGTSPNSISTLSKKQPRGSRKRVHTEVSHGT